jgi:AcrR family transcriptional regulator
MPSSETLEETGTSKRAQNRARKEAAILDAAETLFGAKGFQKTTIGDVASAAGVSRPLIYRAFTDKETLLAAVVERVYKEWNDLLVAEAARATPSTGHTVRLIFLACLDFARQPRVRLLSQDARLAIAGRGVLFNRGSKLLGDLIYAVIERGAERGDVRADLDLHDLANVVTELCLAYSALIVAGYGRSITAQRTEAVVETLLHGIVVRPATESI